MPPHKFKQQGVAIITVLLVVTLATLIATSLSTQQQIDTHRTINIIEGDQAHLLTLGIEAWGQEILEKDLRINKYDALNEDWAKELTPINVENGWVSGRIEDLQARFNLNNLAFLPPPPPPNQTQKEMRKDPIKQYQRLLSLAGIEDDKAEALVFGLVDWLDADQNERFPGGAEDNTYLNEDPPYRTADTLLRSISELLWINGYDKNILAKIEPYITALPSETPININTASIEVLMSLSDKINEAIASDIVDNRGEEGFSTTDQFLQQEYLSGIKIAEKAISADSQHFMVHGSAQFGKIKKRMHSLIVRNENKPSRVVYRSQGAF